MINVGQAYMYLWYTTQTSESEKYEHHIRYAIYCNNIKQDMKNAYGKPTKPTQQKCTSFIMLKSTNKNNDENIMEMITLVIQYIQDFI